MNPYLQRLKEALARLTPRQRVQLGAALVVTLALVWGFTAFANRVRYGVLFSNLDREGAGQVTAALKEQQVPYRISAGGSMVEVPFGQIDELRLNLAADGLPPGGGVGFEIFDKPAFGLSDFVQNVNYRRALERELARTIQSLDAVESARVHLALPPESAFVDEQRDPTASIVVKLRSGRSLAKERMRAITHLVASGVEGLDPTNVSVIDGDGQLLAGGEADEQALTASQYEAKRERERNIEKTLVTILEPIVGRGRVRASATVELNNQRTERREESYDPDVSVVRSQEKKKSKSTSGGPAGIPGTQSNLPGGTVGGATSDQQETNESLTNYEVNRTVATTSEGLGRLLRQSVAVVVDHASIAPAVEDDADGAEGETGGDSARSAEEMAKITEVVRAAIGYDAQRGDVVTVENIPFERLDAVEAPGLDITGTLVKIFRFGSLPLAVLLFALFVIRPAISVLRVAIEPEPAPPAQAEEGADGPLTVAQLQARVQGQLPGGVAGALPASGVGLREKLIEAVAEDPRAAALVVRSWLAEDPSKHA